MEYSIEHIVSLIKRIPTGDNCQPWEFEVEQDSIEITYNHKRDEHFLNQSGIVYYYTRGFLLATIKQVLSHYASSYKLTDGLTRISIKEIKLERPKSSELPLAKRFTDRRKFTEDISSDEIRGYLSKGVESLENKKFSKNLLDHIDKSEKIIWQNASALNSLLKWIILSSREYTNSREGLLYSQVGLKRFELPLIKMIKSYPAFFARIFKSPLYLFMHVKVKVFYKKSVFISYSVDKLDGTLIEDRMSDILNDWVELNKAGYSYQPMNISILPYIDKFLSSPDTDVPELELIKKEFNQNGQVFWLARVGKCKKKYHLPLSLRR